MSLNWKIAGAFALVFSVCPAFAQPGKGYTYLALGDSVPFGFDPLKIKPPATSNPTPSSFEGYPEILTKSKGHVNAACPGETSASFIRASARDNGCNDNGPQGQPPFKYSGLLHTSYRGAQLNFAIDELQKNRKIESLTLSIGGNDLSLLQADCAKPPNVFPVCVAGGLPGVLKDYARNLSDILIGLRRRGNYDKELVLVTYYSPNKDPLITTAVFLLNETMKKVGKKFKAKIADGFGAFQLASRGFGGDPCAAGLLIHLGGFVGPNGACDIHPSPAGDKLLAAAVQIAQRQNSDDDDDDDDDD